jgi:phosphatidylglycerophosphatase GEP4
MNIAATLNIFRLIQNPALCLPQATIPSFNHLPIPLSTGFVSRYGEKVDIRAVVLDKDNCFAKSKENVVYKPYEVGGLVLLMEWTPLYTFRFPLNIPLEEM